MAMNPGKKSTRPRGAAPAKSKARLRGRRPGLAVVGKYKPGHAWRRSHSFGEAFVRIRQRGQELFRRLCTDAVLSHQRQEQFGRGAVRLREVDIESDDGCAGL